MKTEENHDLIYRRLLIAFIVVSLLLFGFGSTGKVLAQTTVQAKVTGAFLLNVRTGPSMGYPVVTVIAEDEVVTVLGKDSVGAWWQVKTKAGKEGWASSHYLAITTGSITSVPVEADYEPSGIVISALANVRTGPDISYPVMTTLSVGNGVGVLGRNAYASWVYVRIPNGMKGWMASNLLSIQVASLYSLPVVDDAGYDPGAGGATPTATPPPTPTTPPDGGQGGGGTAKGTGYINVDFAHVRSGPGTEYSSLVVVGKNVPLELLGRNASTTWIYIKVPGSNNVFFGWISAYLLTADINLSNLPIVNNDGTSSGGGGGTGDGQGGGGYEAGTARVNTGALNVRKGDGIQYDVITVIFEDDLVMVIGRNANSSWYKIELQDGTVGWASSLYLEFMVPPGVIPYTPVE